MANEIVPGEDAWYFPTVSIEAIKGASQFGVVVSKNIEAKAYYPDLARARKICERLGAQLARSHRQRDTYLAVPYGRLKLRESDVFEPCLIYYNRLDMPMIRESSYTLVQLPRRIDDLKQLLSDAIGIYTVVDKQRDRYELDSALINVDEIAGLDSFVEIEVDADKMGSGDEAEKRAQWLKQELGIQENDIVPWSYAELQAMYQQAQHCRNRLADTPKQGRLFLIDGPSGSGKSTLAALLREEESLGLKFIRRHCTRKPRSSEENEYVFVSPEQFRSLAYSGEFLEYRDFQFGMSYGLMWKEALPPLLAGQNAIAIMNWGNARHVRRIFPEAALILSTASLDSLRRRLVSRGIHDEGQLAERLENARRFSTDASDYHLIIHNEDGQLASAVKRIREYILGYS